MAWNLSFTNNRVQATYTGGSEASPNLMSELASEMSSSGNSNINTKVNIADNLIRFTDLRIIGSTSAWVKWDDDYCFMMLNEFGSIATDETSTNANNGSGMIIGLRTTIIIDSDTNGFGGNAEVCGEGGYFIVQKDKNGVSPLINHISGNRVDFPTLANLGVNPAEFIIEGLALRSNSANNFHKLYGGNSRNVGGRDEISNVAMTGDGSVQFFGSTFNNFTSANFKIESEDTENTLTFINCTFGNDNLPTGPWTGAVRGAQLRIDNPSFPNNNWDGTSDWADIENGRTHVIRYSQKFNFIDGTNPIENAKVRIAQSVRVADGGYDTSSAVNGGHASILDFTTDATGEIEQFLIDAMHIISGANDTNPPVTNWEFYQYTAQVRKYEFLFPEFIFQNRNYGNQGGLDGPQEDTTIGSTDNNIILSETDASNLTELINGRNLYDYSKYYWVNLDNFSTESLIVTRSGDTVDTGSYNVVIDATASNVFSFDGSTITIKASTFTGDITTTGTFTLSNGAIHDGLLNNELIVNDGDTISRSGVKLVANAGGTINITLDGISPNDIEVRNSTTLNVSGINNAKTINTTLTETSGSINLDGDLVPSTAYTEDTVNNVITLQSGFTETDLSGLRGLELVDFSASDVFASYSVKDGVRLQIEGDLQIDPAGESISFTTNASNVVGQNPVYIETGGTLRVGISQTINSIDVFSSGTAIEFNGTAVDFFNYHMLVSRGTFIWNGGTIRSQGTLRFFNGSTVTVNKGTLLNISSDPVLFRLTPSSTTGGQNMNIYDLTLDGLSTASRFFSTFGWNTAVFEMKRGEFQTFNGTHPEQELLNLMNGSNVNSRDIEISQSQNARAEDITVLNPEKEVTVNMGTGSACYVKSVRQINISPVDLEGAGVEYSYYGVDYDSGNRAVGPMNSTDGTQDDTANKVYSGTDLTGVLDINLLLAINYTLTGQGGTTDDRTSSGTLPLKVIGYDRQITTWNSPLYGIKALTENLSMTPDLKITESIRATTDALLEIATASNFYDRAKSYLVSNYAGEDNLIVDIEGDTVNAGSYNVVVDATASNVFSFDGSTITIKASTFTGNITTTGTITLNNGAVVNGIRTDSSGTSGVLTLN